MRNDAHERSSGFAGAIATRPPGRCRSKGMSLNGKRGPCTAQENRYNSRIGGSRRAGTAGFPLSECRRGDHEFLSMGGLAMIFAPDFRPAADQPGGGSPESSSLPPKIATLQGHAFMSGQTTSAVPIGRRELSRAHSAAIFHRGPRPLPSWARCSGGRQSRPGGMVRATRPAYPASFLRNSCSSNRYLKALRPSIKITGTSSVN